jgi:predicted RNA binding protein YcfA (HicA-like mRNA interferase family)
MTKLPRDVSGERAVKAIGRAGFVVDHQTGSHVILIHRSDPRKRFSVPRHRALKPGLLLKPIKDSSLTVERFLSLL